VRNWEGGGEKSQEGQRKADVGGIRTVRFLIRKFARRKLEKKSQSMLGGVIRGVPGKGRPASDW